MVNASSFGHLICQKDNSPVNRTSVSPSVPMAGVFCLRTIIQCAILLYADNSGFQKTVTAQEASYELVNGDRLLQSKRDNAVGH